MVSVAEYSDHRIKRFSPTVWESYENMLKLSSLNIFKVLSILQQFTYKFQILTLNFEYNIQ